MKRRYTMNSKPLDFAKTANIIFGSILIIEIIVFGLAYKKGLDIVQDGKFWVW